MNLDETREFFKADRFAVEAAGAVIEDAREGFSRCSLELKPVHRNAAGAVMGGAIFTLADFAFAVAANCGGGAITVSLNSQITYLSGVKGVKLIAEANCVRQGKTTCYYRVTVSDELGTQVAEVVTTGYTVRK